MTATQEISRQILALVATGMDVVDALKKVCGEENVNQMIGELYEQLRAAN